MDSLRSVSYKETGTEAPYVSKPIGSTSNLVTKRIDDLARMGKMLTDNPGLKHLANEAILKQGEITDKLRRNSKYNTGTDVGNFLRRATGTVEHLALVAGSTLAQIPVNGTGTHFVRGFKRDTYLQESTGFKTPVAGSTYSLEGESVPMSEVNSSSTLPTNNTTATPGDLGSLNIGIEGKIEGLGQTNNKYGEYTTFTGEDTVKNANNVQSGASISKPSDLLRNTTPAPESLGIDKKNIKGTIPENVNVAQGNYRSDTTYTEKSTEDNITNANVGAPINNPSGTGEFDQTFAVQTTSLEGEFGISNKKIEGDTAPLENTKATKFTIGDSKTKLGTQENILAAQPGVTGSIIKIPLKDSPTPDEFVDNQMSKQLYSSGSTYTGETAKQHIDILKHGDGINAGIYNRGNLVDDTIGGTSKPIPDKLNPDSATYSQLTSSTKLKDFRETDDFGGGIKTPIPLTTVI